MHILLKEKDLYLASLISSRICHDLLAPVSGAVLATSMLEDSKLSSDITGLITSSIETLSKKLQFFRAAFSFSKGEDSPLIKEAKSFAIGMFQTSKHIIEWQDPPFYDISKEGHWARLILNLGLTAHEALPKGGILKIDLREIPHKVSIISQGNMILFNDETKEALDNPDSSPTLKTLPSCFARYFINLLNLDLNTIRTHEELKLELTTS